MTDKELKEFKLWELIEKAEWKKRHDLDFAQKIYNKLTRDNYKELFEFVQEKLDQLDKKFSDHINNISDDGWWDVRAEIVGRGYFFYMNVFHFNNIKLVQSMVDNYDYVENYQYSFQSHKYFKKLIINKIL